MSSTARFYTLLAVILGTYYVATKVIFDKVYRTTQVVIDEYFHIPQGLLYCNGNFSYWDPKITTLPGLYIVSAFGGLFSECTTYNLRFVNLIASCLNLVLFANILKFVYYNDKSHIRIILQAMSLAILPPLYFFSHVYYTDMLSLTLLLIFTRLCLSGRYLSLILLFGVWAILMRQTNVVWIAMVYGHKLGDLFIRSSRVFGNQYINEVKLSIRTLIAKDVDKSKLKRYYGMWDVYCAIKYHISSRFVTFFKFLTLHDFAVLLIYMVLISGFAVFMQLNGSIVVGDKSAHQASIHLPQMLYFLLFYGVFGLPYVLIKLVSTLKLMYREKILVLLFGIIFSLMVHHNTLVHPYLLADNRHFTFYIWNRWYSKYDFAIYAMVPIYIFLAFSLYDNIKDQNCISFLLPYTLALFTVLALQKLVEVRYFLVPYIVIRLRFGKPTSAVIISEFLWYLLVNVAVFQVFFNKQVFWEDYDYPQRIIW